MATKNDPPPPPPAANEPPPKKKRGKLFLLIGVLVVLLLGAGTVAFLLLTKPHHAEDEETAAESKPKKVAEKGHGKPAYFSLEPFTVNLVSEGTDQYLQLTMTLDMRDEESVEMSKAYTPRLRNDVMMILSSKKASELNSKEGKESLAKELLTRINGVLGGKEGPVRDILFTSFIIQ